MNNLLLLKSVVDGYNINVCGKFSSNSNLTRELECDVESRDLEMGGYWDKTKID